MALWSYGKRSGSANFVAMAVRALLFDFDGTLAETERDGHRVAYNRAFADLELPWEWTPEHYGDLLAVAGGKERLVHFMLTEAPPRPAGDPAALAARIHAQKARRFAEIAESIALRPGVAALVRAAKAAGLTLAIVTTAGEAGVRAVMETVPQTFEAFDLIAAGDVVERKKPAPDIYLYTLDRLKVAANEAIAIEDSAIGLRSARAAGIATIVTPSVYTRDEDFAGAAVVLDSLADIPATDLRTFFDAIQSKSHSAPTPHKERSG